MSIERIFHAAIARGPDSRTEYLREACGSDLELRTEVESLLSVDAEAAGFVQRAVGDALASFEREADFAGSERFLVQRRLGAGGFGVVYQVYDRHRDTVVALKTLPYASAGALYDFKKEFRSLADITHPNLVTLYELISHGDKWFFTMEYVDGVNFLEYVRAGDARGFERLRNSLRQLVEGVSYLHSLGKLHCDLKPQNVLVDRHGRVAILDFGLVKESGPNTGAHGTLAGTPDYVAPEQAAGNPACRESDWYSVGVMLYQALTGSLPYAGDLASVLRMKQIADAPDPAGAADGAPKDLVNVCRDLLNRDPTLRPAGPKIMERLGTARPWVGTAASSLDNPFIGREQELAVLRQEFSRAIEGATAVVYVHGAAGIGKTALVGHFLDEVRRLDTITLLEGRCHEQESVPYKALDRLIDNLSHLLRTLPPDDLGALLPADMMPLCRVFPVLREAAALAGIDTHLSAIPELKELRLRALAGLRELITRVARRKPLVLFIDDLQWGDLDSVPLLADIVHPARALPVLFIGSFRDGETERSPFLQALLKPASEEQGAPMVDISLSDLDPAAAHDLATDLLARRQCAADAGLIARESGGNPFYVLELVNYVARADNSIPRALGLDELVRLRISCLPPAARRLFETIAVAGEPLEPGVAAAAAELTSGAYTELTRLRLERLIRLRSGESVEQVETYHDRLREVTNASLTPDARRQSHYRLAIAWEASGRVDARSLARHFFHAEVPEKAFRYAVKAGDQAAEALAFDNAVQFYRMALQVEPPDNPDKLGLRVRIGDALSGGGRGAESGEAYLVAAETAEGLNRVELKRRAATQFMFSGRMEQGIAVTKDVLGAIGMKIAPTPLHALGSFFVTRGLIRLRGMKFRECTEEASTPSDLLRIDTCMSLVQGLGMVDTIRALPFYARALLLALRSGEPGRIAKALAAEAGSYAISGTRYQRKIEETLKTAQLLADKSGNPHSIGLVALTTGISAFLSGDWKRAATVMGSAEAVLRERCRGVAWEIATAHMMGSVSLYLMGQVGQLARRLPQILKDAEARGDLFECTDLRTRLSHTLCLAADDPARAHFEVDAALKEWGREQFDLQHWWALIGRIEIDLYADRAADAWERVTTEWPLLRRSFLMRVQYVRIESLHHRARAALALAASERAGSRDRPKLLRVAEQDAGRILRQHTAWGNALAGLVQAGVAAVRGKPAQSLSLLESAEADCRAADMELYAGSARRIRGRLIGGDTGRELVEAADEWIAGQEIRNPERMSAMLVPGFSP